MKKWLCFLLAFGFSFTAVYADDDEYYYEDEYEEETPKKGKKAPPKKAKANSESSPSRMGLAVGFDGGLDRSRIGFVYDLGSGIELGFGLGLYRYQLTYDEPDQNGGDPDPTQTIVLIPSFSYKLGKGLLDYGMGIDLGIVMEPISNARPDGGTGFYGTPYFYTSAELIKNVSLKLSAGLNVSKPAAYPNLDNTAHNEGRSEMIIQFITAGTVTFYFM